MPDHFEKAKDDILSRTAGNGGPTAVDLLNAMGALALDVDEAIAASTKAAEERHDESVAAMKAHIKYADKRDQRIEVLEMKAARYERDCPGRLQEALDGLRGELAIDHDHEHAKHMAEHHTVVPRRKGDPEGSDFTGEREQESRQVWLMWMVGSKLGYIITGVSVGLAVWIIERLITGD